MKTVMGFKVPGLKIGMDKNIHRTVIYLVLQILTPPKIPLCGICTFSGTGWEKVSTKWFPAGNSQIMYPELSKPCHQVVKAFIS